MQRFDYRREASAESAARTMSAALGEGGFFRVRRTAGTASSTGPVRSPAART